jgi:hypothetical protein
VRQQCSSGGTAAADLVRALVVLRRVAVDVVVRADRLLELGADDHAGALRRGPAREEHDARARVGERRLEQAHGDAERDARAAQRPLVVRDRPRVAPEALEDRGQLQLALLHGQEEARGPKCRLRRRLAWPWRGARRALREPEHVLDLLGRVLLPAAENV